MESYGKLHPTQARLLKVLADLQGEIPSLRVLGRMLNIASPNTIAHHLRQLEAKGYLIPDASGSFQLIEKPVRDVVYVPLYGNAACGKEEFFAEDNVEEHVPLPARTMRATRDCFLVRARGDSMEPKIHNGDLLLVQRSESADDGQVVVAALEDGIFAKRLHRAQGGWLMQSLNPNYAPVVVRRTQRFRVLGTVRGVLRSGAM
jgi:repressor LexA